MFPIRAMNVLSDRFVEHPDACMSERLVVRKLATAAVL